MAKEVLVLFAHPAIHKSRINRSLTQEALEVPQVTFHDLYESYPDFIIDVKAEQNLLESHDHIVFQHPFYWYSCPAIIKEWLDLVLEYNYAYGPQGNRLKGKTWSHALSTGGPESAYQPGGHNRFTIKEFLAPFQQSASLCGMQFLEPFVIHQAHSIRTPEEHSAIRKRYRQFLENLVLSDSNQGQR